ncbi:MAG TPA: hypothetical protein VHF89_14710 [Solirubrobacteraceae bacterium]|nr:hypothetical protein [Solirubrobacteraceae bacterium]
MLIVFGVAPGWLAVTAWHRARGEARRHGIETLIPACTVSVTWIVALVLALGEPAWRLWSSSPSGVRAVLWLGGVAALLVTPQAAGHAAGRLTRRARLRREWVTVLLRDGRIARGRLVPNDDGTGIRLADAELLHADGVDRVGDLQLPAHHVLTVLRDVRR